MTAVDEFSQLMARIYSAVLAPEQWDSCMTAIGHAFDSGAALVVTDGAARVLNPAAIPADAAATYAAHYSHLDHVLATVEAGPVGAVRCGAELMWPFPKSEFIADWARPNGFDDGMFIRLTASPVVTSLALASPKQCDRFDTAEHVTLAVRLRPHLQLALRMQERLADLAHRVAELEEASEAASHGIVIAERRRPVYTNGAADRILGASDGLRICNGNIEAEAPHADVQLGCSMARASSLDSCDIWGGSFLCARPSGRRPYIIHVLPIEPNPVAAQQPRRVLVVIVDPDQQPEPPATLLRRLYGLTKSEAQVALLVMRGEGLRPIAEELSVSLTTVRTHLRHVFDKTGVHRQAELVRLLAMLDPIHR
ncbi:helix-turn-helix transcriptional regulator [[Mycobacterium] crassicus]|uniref:Helix-turn-helix transcriptional regulator n=1 Tax=[Mycobacterium] crassicus TaxID=2872309 RepID=A0ABU5XJE4_9MYCO|nr:helix-turn-helix transcriptional regulator [Mycolicibacter sp. MYC098]MEB3022400.1 helix-turn-helix transcriptional regulator [Mycolicibacter sp. MYC098]